MQAVLISIQPGWCELIASGKKKEQAAAMGKYLYVLEVRAEIEDLEL